MPYVGRDVTRNTPHARTTLPFIPLFYVPVIFVVRKYSSNEQYWGLGLPILRPVLKSRPSAEELPVRCLFHQTLLPVSSNPQNAIPSVLWYQWPPPLQYMYVVQWKLHPWRRELESGFCEISFSHYCSIHPRWKYLRIYDSSRQVFYTEGHVFIFCVFRQTLM
jgi:hypothetical protein